MSACTGRADIEKLCTVAQTLIKHTQNAEHADLL